jgi:hypothetical protein
VLINGLPNRNFEKTLLINTTAMHHLIYAKPDLAQKQLPLYCNSSFSTTLQKNSI